MEDIKEYYAFFNDNGEQNIFINKDELKNYLNEKNYGTYKRFSSKADADEWLKKKSQFFKWEQNAPQGDYRITPENIPPGYIIDERHGMELVNFINNYLSPSNHHCGILHDKLAWCGNKNYCITSYTPPSLLKYVKFGSL